MGKLVPCCSGFRHASDICCSGMTLCSWIEADAQVMDCSKILIALSHFLQKIVEVLRKVIPQLPNLYHARENEVITFRKV